MCGARLCAHDFCTSFFQAVSRLYRETDLSTIFFFLPISSFFFLFFFLKSCSIATRAAAAYTTTRVPRKAVEPAARFSLSRDAELLSAEVGTCAISLRERMYGIRYGAAWRKTAARERLFSLPGHVTTAADVHYMRYLIPAMRVFISLFGRGDVPCLSNDAALISRWFNVC